MTIELTHVLVMYIVCGDRVECRVRTYAGDTAIEEASVAFSQASLMAAAQSRGEKTWDESDILAVTGCDHWIMDATGKQVAFDVISPEIEKATAFDDAVYPRGPLGTLISSRQVKKPPALDPPLGTQ